MKEAAVKEAGAGGAGVIDPALLSDAALEAAASRGLLRRAQKDWDAGLVTAVAPDGNGAVLTVDGETVRIGAGGPVGARCTCPASGVCRHILAGLLALRGAGPAAAAAAAPPSVPDVSDEAALSLAALSPAALVKAFGRSALREAEAILAEAAVAGGVAIEGGTVRIAGRPPVHFAAGTGPGGAVSKGAGSVAATRALHAAALLALRRHAAGEAMAAPAAVSAPVSAPVPAPVRREEPAFLLAVDAALREAARSALCSAPVSLEERLLDLAVSVRADALPSLAGALRAVADGVAARRNRASGFDPADALLAIARAYALSAALRTGADPVLRGEREGYAPVGELGLIGCGVRVWRSAAGARGVTAHFIAPGAEGGPRRVCATLARAAGQDLAFQPDTAARHHAVWGHHTLHELGRQAFRLHGAGLAADQLALTGGRAVLDGAAWADAVAAHPGLLVASWSVLQAQLADALQPGLRRRPGAVRPVLLAPRATGPVQFDELAQTAWWPVQDADGSWLGLALEPGLVDAQLETLDAFTAGAPPVVSVLARVDGDALVLSPLAVGRGGALEHLDLPPPRAAAPAGTIMERIGRLVSAGMAGRRGPAPRFVPLPRPPTATAALLAAVADDVLGLVELGGRMDDAARLERLRGAADRLDRAGLRGPGVLLGRLAGVPEGAPDGASDGERPHHLLVFSHVLGCLRAMSPGLPWVVPA